MTIKRPESGWNHRKVTIHRGEMLSEEFLKPLGLSQNALAMKIRLPATRIGEVIHGRRSITPDTALRLGRFFGNNPEFWMNMQQAYDMSKAKRELQGKIDKEVEAYVAWIRLPRLRFAATLLDVPVG